MKQASQFSLYSWSSFGFKILIPPQPIGLLVGVSLFKISICLIFGLSNLAVVGAFSGISIVSCFELSMSALLYSISLFIVSFINFVCALFISRLCDLSSAPLFLNSSRTEGLS